MQRAGIGRTLWGVLLLLHDGCLNMKTNNSFEFPAGPVFVPFLDRQRFCQLVGVTPAILAVWVREGRIQTISMGKRSLIDLRPWLINKSGGVQ